MKNKKSKKKLIKARRKQLSSSICLQAAASRHHHQELTNGMHGRPHQVESKPPPIVSGSRKRVRSNVEFVLPKDSSSERKPYIFDKQRKAKQSVTTFEHSHDSLDHGHERKHKVTTESIDDILFSIGKKGKDQQAMERANPTEEVGKGKRSSEETNGEVSRRVQSQTSSQSIDDDEVEGGQLSGLSVEDAVRDKAGCRPRANSTDGELNLPRRGLCDERMVLEAHKWKRSMGHTPPKGFMNLGNTCFLNATLQCLAYLPTFSQTLTSLQIESNERKPSEGQRITLMLNSLFQKVHGMNGIKTGGDAISPHGIVRAVPTLGSGGSRCGYKFRPGQQEDAHEFLVHLLDAMQDGELKAAGIDQHASGWRDRLPIPRLDETTWINRIFGGYLRSQVQCTKCGYRSNTYDPFLDLSLEVSRKSSNSVASAFSEFTRKETLDSRNRWKCSGCKKHVCATKQLTVFRPPLSLCIQLKRFTYGGSSFGGGWGFGHYGGKGMGMMSRGGSKISKPIDFPAELKLPLSDGRICEYHLTGVVVHIGGSASSGHYTAFVKKHETHSNHHQWYHMDDSYVEPVSEKTVLRQKDAYVLFYCRKEVKIEYPSPPPRGFMSAEEARKSGVARARARAHSLDKLDIRAVRSAGPTNNSDERKKEARVLLPASDAATSPELNCSEKKMPPTVNELEDGGRAGRGSDMKSERSSDQSSSSSENSGTKWAQKLYKDVEPSARKANEDKEARTMTSSADMVSAPSQKAESSSSSSVSASGSSSGSEDESSSSDSESSANSEASNHEQDCQRHEPKPSGFDNSKKDNKTRVIVELGGTRGKLEVMLGPRHGSKAWKSKADVAKARDSEHELLGSVKVGKWDDDDDEEDVCMLANKPNLAQSEQRENALKQLEKRDRSRKRKMYLDRWDAMLDEGKTKKVKQKQEAIPMATYEPKKNPFHRIQSGMQRMNRGKAKGWNRQCGTNKPSPRGRGGKNNKRRP